MSSMLPRTPPAPGLHLTACSDRASSTHLARLLAGAIVAAFFSVVGCGSGGGHSSTVHVVNTVMPDAVDIADIWGFTAGPDTEPAEVEGPPWQHPACFGADPKEVHFSGELVGETTARKISLWWCGAEPLAVTSVKIVAGSSPEFGLDFSELGGEPSAEDPLTIPAGGQVWLVATYSPADLSPLNEVGLPVMDEATVAITVPSLPSGLLVKMFGAGVTEYCPVAVITSEQGNTVLQGTVVHLSGAESWAPYGLIEKWEWNMLEPGTSGPVQLPDGDDFELSASLTHTGLYSFFLTVYDDQGLKSCEPAAYYVYVNESGLGGSISVELVWHTPEDPDETDTGPEAGSDLDLHFVHPWAVGPDLDGDGEPDGWFDIPYDCFWSNKNPDWGSFDPNVEDNPLVLLEDLDGGGPETISLAIPENATYRIGVHYWNDHGFGPAYATARFFVSGNLVAEVKDVMMVDSDMWFVGTIEWPSGKVEIQIDPATGGYDITPNYQNPYFFQ